MAPTEQHSDLSATACLLTRDCKVLLQQDLSEAQKLNIVLNFAKFSPPPTYQFPTRMEYGKKRSFQPHYLQSYWWLGYSVQLDGCFCLPCCLFSCSTVNSFVQKPFTNWTKFNEKVKEHAMSAMHSRSVLALNSFKESHSGAQPTIDVSFETNRQELYDLNYKWLDAILGCVVLCGKQNIAFRGHDDADSSLSTNKGNFKAILEYRALGDPVLHQHLAMGPKNAQYTSAKTQNEVILICRTLILQKIADEVKENDLYSIICDECTDSANKEQLSLSVRYVSREKVCKSFVGFFELDEGVTGAAVADAIETAIAECHLDPTKLRGQAYDGASNMTGKYKGCAAIIQQKYPQATYSHCCSHVFEFGCCKFLQLNSGTKPL